MLEKSISPNRDNSSIAFDEKSWILKKFREADIDKNGTVPLSVF